MYSSTDKGVTDSKAFSAKIDNFTLDTISLENYIHYRAKELTIFLGKYTFFDLGKLLSLLTDIYFNKLKSEVEFHKKVYDKEYEEQMVLKEKELADLEKDKRKKT